MYITFPLTSTLVLVTSELSLNTDLTSESNVLDKGYFSIPSSLSPYLLLPAPA